MKKPTTLEVRSVVRKICRERFNRTSVQTWTNKLVTNKKDLGNRSVCFAVGSDARSAAKMAEMTLKRLGFEADISVTNGSGYRTLGGYVRVVCKLA